MNKPTSEQTQVIDYKGNTVVIAGPGSGKTYTVVKKIVSILNDIEDYQGVIAISYTRKASKELKNRVGKYNIVHENSYFSTIDSFILSNVIYKFSSRLTTRIIDYEIVNIDKLIKNNINNEWLYNLTINNLDENSDNIISLLEDGYIPVELIAEIGIFIMSKVNQCKVYFQAKYTHIIIDEYQDCDEAKHYFFNLLVDWNLIGIAVGDPNQSIYAYSGKHSIYLMELYSSKSFESFELTINHRSHKSIINFSDIIMNRPISFPLEENKRIFVSKTEGDEIDLSSMIYAEIELIKRRFKIKEKDIAFLCRGWRTAEKLHKSWKGKSKLLTRTKFSSLNSANAIIIDDLLKVYVNHRYKEIAIIDVLEKFHIENNYKNNQLINDFLNNSNLKLTKIIEYFNKMCMIISNKNLQDKEVKLLAEILVNDDELLKYVNTADDEINIITIHSSKGMEYDCVFIFDMYKWVISDERFRDNTDTEHEEHLEQNWNLFYVAVSRAKKLVYIMQGDKRYNRYGEVKFAQPSSFLQMPKINNQLITFKDSLGAEHLT